MENATATRIMAESSATFRTLAKRGFTLVELLVVNVATVPSPVLASKMTAK